ncbi:cupin domain-containing protein [Flavobacteriaceae bacterium 3-367]|uniref:cupin domain-containing protein n=1 Tax=Eudoraea algarum TaxID=3417568 RepID=UPI00328C6DA5
MYQTSHKIDELECSNLKVEKLFFNAPTEVLAISLEEGKEFPEHSSPRDAFLVMLEGQVLFYINDREYPLRKHQTFNFPAEKLHAVKAIENAKFLIIR